MIAVISLVVTRFKGFVYFITISSDETQGYPVFSILRFLPLC